MIRGSLFRFRLLRVFRGQKRLFSAHLAVQSSDFAAISRTGASELGFDQTMRVTYVAPCARGGARRRSRCLPKR